MSARTKPLGRSRAQALAEFDAGVAEFFLRIALDEARKGRGLAGPGALAGAILVKGGRIVGRGYRSRGANGDAALRALSIAGEHARGADLYTTATPVGETAESLAWAQGVLAAGVRRVVVGADAPEKSFKGQGLAEVRQAGVEVQTGVLPGEVEAMNRPFSKVARTGLPWVTLKAAVSLDGKLATRSGDSRWVSGDAARAWVHRLRNEVDAVLVGAGTVRKDNPRLTTRLPDGPGRDAVRVILSSGAGEALSPRLHVFQQGSRAQTLVATCRTASAASLGPLEKGGAAVWRLPAVRGRVAPAALLRKLAEQGLQHVLLEGGAEVFASFVRAQVVDELILFVAPKLVGGDGKSWLGPLGVKRMSEALRTEPLALERVGEDWMVRTTLGGAP